MDTPLAPPLRLTPKYAPTSVSHNQVADTIGWFLNAYAERTGGAPSGGPKNAEEAMLAATMNGGEEAQQAGSASAGGNSVITTQLNRLKEELRHS